MDVLSETARPLEERVRAWWLDVVTGHPGSDHPVFGSAIRARLAGDTLRITGWVESAEARRQLREETRFLLHEGVHAVECRVTIRASPEERGLLKQLLLAFFLTVEQAEFAQKIVHGLSDIHPLVSLAAHGDSAAPSLARISTGWSRRIDRQLRKTPALLLLELDEIDVFRAKGMLEETNSAEIFVLPPEPYGG